MNRIIEYRWEYPLHVSDIFPNVIVDSGNHHFCTVDLPQLAEELVVFLNVSNKKFIVTREIEDRDPTYI